jgi:hypothetical protein
VVSVCKDKNWAVLGRFFQSLPVPCGVFWGVGGRESLVKHGAGGTGGEGPSEGAQHGRRKTDGCIMHRVHTSRGLAGVA